MGGADEGEHEAGPAQRGATREAPVWTGWAEPYRTLAGNKTIA